MDPPIDFKALQEAVQKSLVSTVKSANKLAAEDLSFQRTVNPDVATQLQGASSRLLELSNRLLGTAARACNVKAPKLEDAEDIDMSWRSIVDVVDSVLEKADTAMDEYTGLVKRKDPPTTETGSKSKKAKPVGKVIRNANIPKPQKHFELQPDNFPTTPWKPIISKKPHATVPLDESLVTFEAETGATQYKHPYETEIMEMKYPERAFKVAEPIPYQPVESTEATWVDTYEGVLEMLEELKQAKEIAVDLEHHDFRTYVGLVSLMQISTRDKDWIVDTLKPWRHKLEVLNEVFADPSIIKVFHGAYMDMVWLQRDLGLYVVGLFDTYFACQLMYSARSLAFLLSKFVNFEADKQYQLADWRMRPLPDEMMYYARSDTHYLLYIYDKVRNDFVSADDSTFITQALQNSKELSLSRHEHPTFNDETGEGAKGWYGYILKNSHLSFNSAQFAVFRALWKWRDVTARTEDENPNFVLGTNQIVEIARVNPPDVKALHSLLPLSSPHARSRLNELWEQVRAAKAKGGPSLLQFFTSLAPESLQRKKVMRTNAPATGMPALAEGVAVGSCSKSQLFGAMPVSSRWEARAKTVKEDNRIIPFPWQRFVDDAAADVDQEIVEEAATEPEVAEPHPAQEADEEFTLKKGRKRKSEALEQDSSSTSEESTSEEEEDEEMTAPPEPVAPHPEDANGVINIDDSSDEGEQQMSKKARKKLRQQQRKEERQQKQETAEEELARKREEKAVRKALKKEKRAAEKQAKEKMYDAVPFDYSTATSVMNAARQASSGKKAFDPYSKSAEEAVKGARKAPPIRGERSGTFKRKT